MRRLSGAGGAGGVESVEQLLAELPGEDKWRLLSLVLRGGWDGCLGWAPDVPLHSCKDFEALSILDAVLLRLLSRDALAVLLGYETLAQANKRLEMQLKDAVAREPAAPAPAAPADAPPEEAASKPQKPKKKRMAEDHHLDVYNVPAKFHSKKEYTLMQVLNLVGDIYEKKVSSDSIDDKVKNRRAPIPEYIRGETLSDIGM